MADKCLQGFSYQTIQGVSGCFRDKWKDPDPFGPLEPKKQCSDSNRDSKDFNKLFYCADPGNPQYAAYANDCWHTPRLSTLPGCSDEMAHGYTVPPPGHFVCTVNTSRTRQRWTNRLDDSDEFVMGRPENSNQFCNQNTPVKFFGVFKIKRNMKRHPSDDIGDEDVTKRRKLEQKIDMSVVNEFRNQAVELKKMPPYYNVAKMQTYVQNLPPSKKATLVNSVRSLMHEYAHFLRRLPGVQLHPLAAYKLGLVAILLGVNFGRLQDIVDILARKGVTPKHTKLLSTWWEIINQRCFFPPVDVTQSVNISMAVLLNCVLTDMPTATSLQLWFQWLDDMKDAWKKTVNENKDKDMLDVTSQYLQAVMTQIYQLKNDNRPLFAIIPAQVIFAETVQQVFGGYRNVASFVYEDDDLIDRLFLRLVITPIPGRSYNLKVYNANTIQKPMIRVEPMRPQFWNGKIVLPDVLWWLESVHYRPDVQDLLAVLLPDSVKDQNLRLFSLWSWVMIGAWPAYALKDAFQFYKENVSNVEVSDVERMLFSSFGLRKGARKFFAA